MLKKKLYQALEQHVPENSVHYCYDLWESNPFTFKITKSRKSRFGDYRYQPISKNHIITINHDLNKFAFLITYLHEVAHLHTFLKSGHKISPHGLEWKRNFKSLLQPVCNDLIFPASILTPLKTYMINPKASSCGDPRLYKALRSFDTKQGDTGLTHLSELEPGCIFTFRERQFQKIEIKRTRSVCQEIRSGKRYLISDIALVQVI